jgi:hypothetical protein
LNAYPVLVAPNNEIVAQFTMTVAVNPTNTIALSGLPLDESHFKTDKVVKDATLNELLSVIPIK